MIFCCGKTPHLTMGKIAIFAEFSKQLLCGISLTTLASRVYTFIPTYHGTLAEIANSNLMMLPPTGLQLRSI